MDIFIVIHNFVIEFTANSIVNWLRVLTNLKFFQNGNVFIEENVNLLKDLTIICEVFVKKA